MRVIVGIYYMRVFVCACTPLQERRKKCRVLIFYVRVSWIEKLKEIGWREVLSVTAPEPCGICIIIYYICVVCTRKLANLEYGRVYT